MLALVTKNEAGAGSPLGAARVWTAWWWRKIDVLGVAVALSLWIGALLGRSV